MGVFTNLPAQLTSFIGRERDLAEIEQLLSAARLVTLTGAGGCGKTRLAIQVASAVRESFADGVWFVDLAPLHELELVPQLVAQALGLHPAAEEPVLEALLNWVMSKRLLLVLDNCEHLILACTQLAGQLLSHAPDLHILATSREPLAVAGEMVYPLHGLSGPLVGVKSGPSHKATQQGALVPQDIIGYDAVRLFVERGRATLPGFTLTSENANAVAEICQRLDGLPLAIELASARVKVLTVQEIAARLDDRFALLISGQRRGIELRHQTLRAAIDWSYDLLPAEQQILLSRLAVFAAGCTLDTAETVCAGEGIVEGQVLDLLSSLVDKSFIVAETTGRAQARYRMLETIREYALDKLNQSGEAARLRNCHLDLFLARAEEAAPKLNDSYQQLWLNWLEGEHDNLRAALAWSLEGGSLEKGQRIAGALTLFWQMRGYLQECMAWFSRLLMKVDQTVSPIVRATTLSYAAFTAMLLGDASTTQAYGREAVALAESAGDQGKEALALAVGALASGARAAGDYATAFKVGERLIRLQRQIPGQPFLLSMALISQGGVAIELGYYDAARPALEESLALAREAGDSYRIAVVLNSFGDLARGEQKYQEALAIYENSAALLRELGAQHDLASVLQNLGFTCLHLGDAKRAHALFQESLAAQQTVQNLPGISESLIGYAAIAIRQDLPAASARLLCAAASIAGKRVAMASVWHATRLEYAQTLQLAQASLSEADFQAEQAAGRAMTLEQAVEYAQNLQLTPETAPASAEMPEGLTTREREVAALIGQGKTNSEIAAELVLSKRTIETHVSNILSKLELTSRTQVMRWAIDRGLTQTPT